ncbi:hypothetical protein CDCA_CDCA15G3945 [Cyanidium caldarium]|uniref:HSF-type DNA-binding domain-containing protein n=1 Tax=Cyanidium caldarium TaxID=2771 RepID=A0AAV9J011_CYACA|nr:hypothetical protein CDCA_CDCA15G3945 [Cyanidium caldarium]
MASEPAPTTSTAVSDDASTAADKTSTQDLWEKTLLTPFVSKLRAIVDDPTTDHIISWREDGLSFQVHLPTEFAQTILPRYFRHNNLISFARQLNQYSFRKLDRDHLIFGNRYFVRDKPELLAKVVRRRPSKTLVQREASALSGATPALELGHYGLGNDASSSGALSGDGIGGDDGDIPSAEVELLQRDKKVLIKGLVESRRQQVELERRLHFSEQRIHQLETSVDQLTKFLYQSFQLLLQQRGVQVEPRKRKRLTHVDASNASPLSSLVYKGDSIHAVDVESVPSTQTLAVRHNTSDSMEMIRHLLGQLQMASLTSPANASGTGAATERARVRRATPSTPTPPPPSEGGEVSASSDHEKNRATVRRSDTGGRSARRGPSVLLLDDELDGSNHTTAESLLPPPPPPSRVTAPHTDTAAAGDAPSDDHRIGLSPSPSSPMMEPTASPSDDFNLEDYLNLDELLDADHGDALQLPSGADADFIAEEVRKMLGQEAEASDPGEG